MPVLRRPHDHRRDLRARLPTKTPAHTGSRGDQGRHLMTLSPPIDHRYHTGHARWRAAAHAYACIRLIDSMPAALPIVSHHAQPARSPRPAHLCDTANRSQRPPPPNLIKPRPVAKSPSSPAAAPPHHRPRFPALALFGRRPHQLVDGLVIASPKTLYGAYRCQEETRHVRSHFVTSLDCIAARLPLLGCAERSEPRSRVRRAEGAGLDRECADRVTISLPQRANVLRALFDLLCGFLFWSFSFHRHASFRSLKIRFDMIRGELAIGRGNRATTVYSVDPRGSVP